MEQWILIRGEDRTNPLLLWLHGGPGAAQMLLARHFNADLEKDFTIVHWDQRGAGKSNPPDFDEGTMTWDRYKADTVELVTLLREQFRQEKIYLLGHSWGSQLGVIVVQENPELFHAYIGVSQLVDPLRAQDLAYQWLNREIETSGSRSDRARLEELGLPRYREHTDYVTFSRLVDRYGGNMDAGMGSLAWLALQSPEYRWGDYYRWLQGAARGSGPMWEETQSFSLLTATQRFELPVYFITGKNDRNTPLQLVEEFYDLLESPSGKKLLPFAHSAHTPFLAEPERFNQELVRIKNETLP